MHFEQGCSDYSVAMIEIKTFVFPKCWLQAFTKKLTKSSSRRHQQNSWQTLTTINPCRNDSQSQS